ncbi:MAG: NUDIX hydrolase [Acidimicrobiaceae bacterium]|nr:NUDIX hydrolase [Acidimicrobiaceae bacterium]
MAATDEPTRVASEELVEWVDEDDRVIAIVPRARMRAENLLHRSVAVIVTTSDGRLVVQRRSTDKDLFPGWWDIGAGGVVTAGEDRASAARRELAEELGVDGVDDVDANPSFVGVGRHDDDHAREICWIYRTVSDGPFRAIDGEVSEIRVVDTEEFAALSAEVPFLPGSVALLLPHVPGFATVTAVRRRPGTTPTM